MQAITNPDLIQNIVSVSDCGAIILIFDCEGFDLVYTMVRANFDVGGDFGKSFIHRY